MKPQGWLGNALRGSYSSAATTTTYSYLLTATRAIKEDRKHNNQKDQLEKTSHLLMGNLKRSSFLAYKMAVVCLINEFAFTLD